MRISTLSLQQQGIDAIISQQSRLARTQLQVATGRRILSPADDPIGAQQILELDVAVKRLAQFKDNADLVRARLGFEESVLSSIGGMLQRGRELVIQAANDTQTNEARGLIALEIRQLADQLLQLANSKDGQGEYLFSGFKSTTQPFARSGGIVVYSGDQGRRLLQIGDERKIADGDSGAEVFQLIRNGNGTYSTSGAASNTGSGVIAAAGVTDPSAFDGDTYSIEFTSTTDYEVKDSGGGVILAGTYSGGGAIAFRGIQVTISGAPQGGDSFNVSPSVNQDLFTTFDNLINALETTTNDDTDRAQLHNALNGVLNDLDQGIGGILDVRSLVGSRLNTVERQVDTNAEMEIQFEGTLAEIRDLDFVEAVGRLNSQLGALEAAQLAFVRVQQLSLFDFL